MGGLKLRVRAVLGTGCLIGSCHGVEKGLAKTNSRETKVKRIRQRANQLQRKESLKLASLHSTVAVRLDAQPRRKIKNFLDLTCEEINSNGFFESFWLTIRNSL